MKSCKPLSIDGYPTGNRTPVTGVRGHPHHVFHAFELFAKCLDITHFYRITSRLSLITSKIIPAKFA